MPSFICLQCDDSTLTKEDNKYRCSTCKVEYPILFEKIPIIVKNPVEILTTTYIIYKRFISQYQTLINKIPQKSLNQSHNRVQSLKNLSTALASNLALINKGCDEIKKVIIIDDFDKYYHSSSSTQIPYLMNFDYLSRDWSWNEDGELEISIISKKITEVLSLYPNLDRENCIILGAGTGRLLFEMKNEFEKVIGVDYSLTMIKMFYDVLEHDIEFYNIDLKNQIDYEYLASPQIATLGKYKNNQHNIDYFLSDTKTLPYQNNSISCIMSIYFTDVIKIENYITELTRVLKNGGLFIHFGPLEYHFEDLLDMYSLNDIKQLFIDNDFEIIESDFIHTEHKKKPHSLSNKVYKNAFFVAKKTNQIKKSLIETDVPVFSKDIKYYEEGVITTDNEIVNCKISLKLSEHNFLNDAEFIFEVLKLVNSKISFKEIISTINLEHNIDVTFKDLAETFQSLLDNKIITI